jgi:hypothetical protein
LQPGGHRFDPGQLHQKKKLLRWVVSGGRVQEIIERFLGLGVFLIPIIAIIVGGVIAIVGMVHKHQERIAKIERGINPDGPWPQQK